MFRTASRLRRPIVSLRFKSHPHYCPRHTSTVNRTGRWPRFSFAGLFLACAGGGSWALAEYRASPSDSIKQPKKSFYKYLICGGGIAAREALRVFLEEGAAADVLLVSSDWRNENNGPVKLQNGDVESMEEGVMVKALHNIGSIIKPLSSSISSSGQEPEILVGRSVRKIDSSSRVAILDNGSEVAFERCLIAVGGSIPEIPIGKVVSRDAANLVSGAQSSEDWERIDSIVRDGLQKAKDSGQARPHLTVVGGGWMSTAVGAELVNRGANVTFSFAEPGFMSRYFPKYVAQDVLSRLVWASEGGVDSLSYAALRYVIARRPSADPQQPLEAEVHVGTVFDSFSIVDFRTDHVIFAPTLAASVPLHVTAGMMEDGGFVVSPELAVASDVYAAGGSLCVGSGAVDYARVMRWSADHARATGRHAARNILGARKPYSYIPSLSVNLDSLRLRVHVIGDVDGSRESFGYFHRSKNRDEDTCGGHLEKGALFCVKPAPLSHRGASQKLHISGVALWDGSKTKRIADVEGAREAAKDLLQGTPMTRPQLEEAMDNFASSYLDIQLLEDSLATSDHSSSPDLQKSSESHEANMNSDASENSELPANPFRRIRKPSRRVIWRRHRSARAVRVRPDELLWVRDEWEGAVSPDTHQDKVSRAYEDVLKRAAGI